MIPNHEVPNVMTAQPKSYAFTLRFAKAVLCMLFACGVLTGAFARPAAAQPARDQAVTAPTGDSATVSQLVRMLVAPVDAQRDRAFQQVVQLAYYRPEVDLRPAVPVLVDIYNNDPQKKYRLAAVTALYAIGDEAGLQQVRERVLQEPSLFVQYISLKVLLAHYGPRMFAGDASTALRVQDVFHRWEEARRLARHQADLRPVASE